MLALPSINYLNRGKMSLDLMLIRFDYRQAYRLFTSPLLGSNGTWQSLLIHQVGVHVGTWFVIAATKGRWQKMLLAYFYNYLALCLAIYLINDPLAFAAPLLPLLTAQVAVTYMLEDTQTYVP